MEELKYEYTFLDDRFDIDGYFAEMATIAVGNGYNISVNNELKHLSVAYFKVYDNENIMAAKKVVRLHFKDSGVESHKRDSLLKKPWLLNASDKENIKELLEMPSRASKKYTAWNFLCFTWDIDNGLIPSGSDLEDFMTGKFDATYAEDSRLSSDRLKSAYVPSTQEIPETWGI